MNDNAPRKDYYEVALDFLIKSLESGDIETGLPKNSQGKGGYSISNTATEKLAQLIEAETLQAKREVVQDSVYGAIAEALSEIRKELKSKKETK